MTMPNAMASNATRQRLLSEALKLFARNGLNGGVSLRQIVQAAGAGNPSALHYHFGSRDALVTAIAHSLQEWLEPRCLARLQALDDAPSGTTVRALLEALFGPVMDMIPEPGLGRDAIRFISRLGWDFGPEGQALSANLHRKSLDAAFVRLQPLLPELPEQTLKFRLILNMNNVYHGLANQSYLWQSPFGSLDVAALEHRDALREMFVDYLEAGLVGVRRQDTAAPP